MDFKVVKNVAGNMSDRIPTRYDDIMKEIVQNKMTALLNAYEKDVMTPEGKGITYYRLGDVLGETLNKVV